MRCASSTINASIVLTCICDSRETADLVRVFFVVSPDQEVLSRSSYRAEKTFLRRESDGNGDETYARSESGANPEAPRSSAQGSSDPQTSGHRCQGRSHTEEE
jgi:hypothetical protein